jgi:hypothetical protein
MLICQATAMMALCAPAKTFARAVSVPARRRIATMTTTAPGISATRPVVSVLIYLWKDLAMTAICAPLATSAWKGYVNLVVDIQIATMATPVPEPPATRKWAASMTSSSVGPAMMGMVAP